MSDEQADLADALASRLAGLLDTVEQVAAALEAMGSEDNWNLSTPQAVRDLCRHQARRLREALASTENDV